MVEYRVEQIVNEDGMDYGLEYQIVGPSGKFLQVQKELIETVIGEDVYYGQRGVWDQIVIVDAR